jgi:hypothetical protein
MPNLTTWESVRIEYGKMSQMGFQSVLQAAKVGEMLIALKKETPYREFSSTLERFIPEMTKSTRANLMTLASNMPLLEKRAPDSQRAALALIAEEKPKKVNGFRIGWVYLLVERVGVAYGEVHNKRAELTERLGEFPSYFKDKAEADAFVDKYLRIIGAPKNKPSRAELTIAQQKKLDTAIKIEHIRLEQQFHAEVDAEVDRRCAVRKQHYQELEEKAITREAQCAAAMAKIDSYMTEDEYKFILNCLHPDRAPADRKDRFNDAFVIFKRLETYVIRTLPLSVLRERGWAR